MEQARKKAKERREKFERENAKYVQEHLDQVIEPLIVNLLNE